MPPAAIAPSQRTRCFAVAESHFHHHVASELYQVPSHYDLNNAKHMCYVGTRRSSVSDLQELSWILHCCHADDQDEAFSDRRKMIKRYHEKMKSHRSQAEARHRNDIERYNLLILLYYAYAVVAALRAETST